jgi:hypothetical protein
MISSSISSACLWSDCGLPCLDHYSEATRDRASYLSGRLTGAAISNAVFDAADIPLRSVPYTPAKVKAALSSA